jgi:hypothetical protein
LAAGVIEAALMFDVRRSIVSAELTRHVWSSPASRVVAPPTEHSAPTAAPGQVMLCVAVLAAAMAAVASVAVQRTLEEIVEPGVPTLMPDVNI